METKYEEAYKFIESHPLATLSTASAQGEPWGANIYCVASEELNFYFMTHVESKKYQNLIKNPKAALTLVDNNEQTTIQAIGSVAELPDESEEVRVAFGKLARIRPPGELQWTPPVSKMTNGKIAVFRLKPTMLKFSRFDTRHHPPHPDIKQII